MNKVKFKKCLLIINKYSNYINMCFIETCNKQNIILIILFLHATHWLQLLNLKIFLLLLMAYLFEIDWII